MSHLETAMLGQHGSAQQATTMTSILRKQALSLIQPCKTLDWLEHPFTTGELIILSAIALDEATFSRKMIFREICHRFTQYAFRAVNVCNNKRPLGRNSDRYGSAQDEIVTGFDEAIALYDQPLIRQVVTTSSSAEDDDPYDRRSAHDQDQHVLVYTLDHRAARIY